MARLILEEGGERRAFRFKSGKLTIGSGDGCTLTLKSGEVAEIHCDLEIGEGRVVLRTRAGVQPPLVNGTPAQGETVLSGSAVIGIGDATIRLDLDESAAPAASSAPTDPGRAAKRPAAQAPSPKVASKAGGARVQRTQRTVSTGMPTWGYGLILVGVVGVGWLVFRNMDLDAGTGYDPVERIRVATEAFNDANYGGASQSLDLIDETTLSRMSPELRSRYTELRSRIESKGRETELALAHMLGTKWKGTQLERFRTDRLHGTNPPRERVRVYLKRVKEFKERWPAHPEMDEVLRYEARYKEICDLSEPATFTDMAYEVKTMTWAMPRDYKGAFQVVEKHLIANPGDAAHCNELLATMRTEQAEHFDDRIQQFKYLWDKGEKGQAVEELVQLIIKLEDVQMVQKAADEFVLIPGIDGWLKGYEQDRPEKYKVLIEHHTIAAKVRELAQ